MSLLRLSLFALLLSFTTLSFAIGAPHQVAAININTADAALIAKTLKGVGLKKAQAIVAYRETFGEFKSAGELEDVKGIGAKTIAKNQAVIVFE